MPTNDSQLKIEVAYVNNGRSHLIAVELLPPVTIAEAIAQSEIQQQCPEINLQENRVGIHSKIRELSELVSDGDRIEIYRPLLADPKDSRRQRAAKQKAKAKKEPGKTVKQDKWG